jgi:molybdenum cofactor cytidylyltransferase
MGRNKLLLRLEGEAVVRKAARRALDAGLDPVIVVLGHDSEIVALELEGLPVRIVVNRDHAEGIHTSRRAGLAAVPSVAGAAVVLLADMPFVTEQMLATLVARYRDSDALLVTSDYAGETAPPNLYDRELFAEIAGQKGEGRAEGVARRHGIAALAVAWPAFALADLDLPEDYERASAADAVSGGAD